MSSDSTPQTLLKDIEAQFNNPDISDIKIITNDSREIYVSSFILRARSSHFQKVLESGMKESASKEIRIEASYQVVEALFKYLYTDTLESNPKETLDIMMLADMYLLEGLRALCENKVKQSVTIHNALDLFAWSKNCHFRDLSDYVSHFFWENFGCISKTQEFEHLLEQNLELFKDLLSKLPSSANYSY
jgi:BTB/POZ domain